MGEEQIQIHDPLFRYPSLSYQLPCIVIENNSWASDIALWTKVCLCEPGDLNSVPMEDIPDSTKLSSGFHLHIVAYVSAHHICVTPPLHSECVLKN